MKKQLWAVLAMMLALMMCVPMTAGAYEPTIEMIDSEGNDVYDYGCIWESGTYTVQGRDPYNGITVGDEGLEVVLILNGVEIPRTYGGAGLECTTAKKVTLVLKDGTSNLIQGSDACAGIWNGRAPLEIYCESAWNGEEGHVCDNDCGALVAFGNAEGVYAGAGIGGGRRYEGEASAEMTWDEFNASGCNITIYGGNINAQGGNGAAGIGGGAFEDWGYDEETDTYGPIFYVGSGRDITIVGGNVYAQGGDGAAGIGGAMNTGLIDLGPVVENPEDYRGGSGERISITGGNVEAYGGMLAPGIGGGYLGRGKDILITGGNVYAQAGMLARAMKSIPPEGDSDPIEYMPMGSGAKLPGDDATPDASNIRIAPKSGTRIRAGAGNSLGRAAEDNELKGSPFTSGKDITDQLKGKTWFATMTEDAPNTAQPSTGDGMGVGFWAALLVLSAAAFAAMKRRMA